MATHASIVPGLMVVSLASLASAGQTVLYVDDDAAPGGNGQSWTSAYQFLQDALSIANAPNGLVSEIRVAGGMYLPDRSAAVPAGSGARGASFLLPGASMLRGGYFGLAAPDPSQYDDRDIAVHETVLHGDLAGNDGTGHLDYTDNSYRLLTAIGAGASTLLEGFTIRGARADLPPNDTGNGGGIAMIGGGPTFARCLFIDNVAAAGGAVHSNGTNATFTTCRFENNRGGDCNIGAGTGGGVFLIGGDTTFVDCDFVSNWGFGGPGGGIFAASADFTLTGCTFTSNIGMGGGGVCTVGGSASMRDCVFTSNTADGGGCGGGGGGGGGGDEGGGGGGENGAGIDGGGGGVYQDGGDLTMYRCTLTENFEFISSGGGVFSANGSAVINHCRFTGNYTFTRGGGLSVANSVVLVGNTIIDASCAGGHCFGWSFGSGTGAALCNTGLLGLSNCTIYGNDGQIDAGALFDDGTGLTLMQNSIIWANIPDAFGGAGTPVIRWSDVQGGYPGDGNLAADPLVDLELRLLVTSPCIDAGHNWAAPRDAADADDDGNLTELVPTDLDGAPRFAAVASGLDTGCGHGAIIDMGAFEFEGLPHIVVFADVNGDQVVNVDDLIQLILDWGGCVPNDCCLSDLNLSGTVDVDDLVALIVNWG